MLAARCQALEAAARNQTQKPATAVQFVPGLRLLAIDSACGPCGLFTSLPPGGGGGGGEERRRRGGGGDKEDSGG
eukprot:308961-Rhodomonas_salina.2